MTIHIKKENRGKFTATKKRTGKTTEELTHSKNPLTRKRAIFAQNAKHFHHQTGGYTDVDIQGYSDGSPYSDEDYLYINGDNITMAQTGRPLTAVSLDEYDNILGIHDLEPYSGEYEFEGADRILEIPKGQVGVDPRLQRIQSLKKKYDSIETFYDKGKKEKTDLYNQMNALRQDIKNKPYQAQTVPANPALPLNTNTGLVNDLDFSKSREINLPFVNKSNVSNTTPKQQTVNTGSSKPTKFKSKQPVVTNNTTIKKPVSYWNEYTPAQLEQQAIDYAPVLEKQDLIVNSLPVRNDNVSSNTNTQTRNNKAVEPISMSFDNPLELQALNYRKLKNNSVLAPYRGSVNLRNPQLYQESLEPYMNNVREQRNALLQQLNPNTSQGQAVLSGINSNMLNSMNQVTGEVNRNNQQALTNYLNQVQETANKQGMFNYENDLRYSNDIAQLRATQDENDINYMDSLANMNAKRLQAKNRFLTTAIETGLPSEALNVQDNGVTFDVTKIPYEFYNRLQGTTPTESKPVKMNGQYYNVKKDANGKSYYEPVDIRMQYGGKFKKYSMSK